MSDVTNTQVGIQMINKCRTKMALRRLYNMGSPHERRGWRVEKEYCSDLNCYIVRTVIDTLSFCLLGLKVYEH